jgi:hypothetical protein
MINWPLDPWENGVLSEEHHGNFVKRASTYAADAGIPAPYLWCPDKVFDSAEREWVLNFRKNRADGVVGLAYIGKQFHPPIEHRMACLAGKLTRNFIGVKVLMIEQVFIESRYSNQYPAEKCIFLPTFCDVKSDAQRGYSGAGLLLQRFGSGNMQTVIAAPSWEELLKAHGQTAHDHVRQNYTIIAGGKS